MFSSYDVKNVCVLSRFSHVWLFETLWPVACQAPSSAHGILQARILEWVAMPFPRGSSQARDQTSALAGGFFPTSATGEAPYKEYICIYIYTINLTYCWSLITWLRSWLSSFSTAVTPPHPTLCFLEEVTMHSPHLRNEELCSTSLRVECLHQLFWKSWKAFLFFPIYLFIYSTISINMNTWIFILNVGL